MANIPVALQLYTVRDRTASDFLGTLRQVAEIGYAGVELAGVTGGMSGPDLKRELDALGLRAAGSHTGIEQLEKDLSGVIEFNKAIGNPYVVVPYLGEERRRDAAGWRSVAESMNRIGKELKAHGLQLCYHNHSFEFQQFDGQSGFDIFYSAADPALVAAEVDTYWVQHGGQDPIAYLEKYAGRVPLVHMKDMAGDEKRSFAEVGSGIMDMAGIVKAAGEIGAQWLIVEQDICPGDTLASARLSYENMKANCWA